MNQSTDSWLPVVGYEGLYEVSDLGLVRSLDHYSRAGAHASRLYRGRQLRAVPGELGRLQVSLHDGAGRQKTRLVHHLVLEAFVGPKPDGTEACHGDGDASNNRLTNLRWDTHVSNEADKRSHGTHTNSVKRLCPRGHGLVEPNLVLSELRRGHRKCMACNRARAYAQKRGLPLSESVADRQYERIMERGRADG